MRGLNALYFVVIIAYLVGITLLGIYVGRRQRDAKDYFVADREIPWWAVLFSIVASETSALTFISIPGLAYVGNLGYPNIHPVFADFAKKAQVVSIGEPGHTDALEFDDGKLMLGKLTPLNDVNWDNLMQRVGATNSNSSSTALV